jgi:uncharacterized membrane protein YkgB
MPVAPAKKHHKKHKKDKKHKVATRQGTPEEIELQHENVLKYSSRLHVTSAVLIAIGAIGAVVSTIKGFHARKMATKFLKPHHTNSTESEIDTSQFVSTDMFALVDNIRIISFILFITSMSIACLGKMALRSTHKLKAHFSKKVFRRSIFRILFIVVMLLLAKSYVKECKHIVRNHNGGHKHHHHGGRKLMAVENDADAEEIVWDQEEKTPEISAKDLIDTLRGKFEDADKQFKQAEKQMTEQMKEAKEVFDEKKPEWMKKGLFAFDPEDDKQTSYTFEKEDGTDDEEVAPQPAPKKHHHGKHRRHHKPCMVITILAVALLGSHLYQLKHLAKSLNALQEMGVKPKGGKHGKKDKKDKKAVEEDSSASEATIQEVPAEINYSFSDHTEDCEDQPEMQFPVVQQPAPTYIIGNNNNMC